MIRLGKYEIIEDLTRGAFGKIYRGIDIYTGERVAIKTESVHINSLKNEAKIYNYLNNNNYFPKFKGYIKDQEFAYLILELLDYSVKGISRPVREDLLKDISIQMINAIEFIHDKGIVHRDIKPDNFMILGMKIKLIDFGFAKQIIRDNRHIEETTISDIIGTPNYISINVHKLCEPSRRDDIESFLYVILSLETDLKWINTNMQEKRRLKTELISDNLAIQNILIMCRQMKFWDRPNYTKIQQHLSMTSY